MEKVEWRPVEIEEGMGYAVNYLRITQITVDGCVMDGILIDQRATMDRTVFLAAPSAGRSWRLYVDPEED